MDEDMTFMPKQKLLTLEEIVFLLTAFAELGVERIRITGGEPLVRRNVDWLFQQLGKLKKNDFVKRVNHYL
jgi:cyclic pyranopterin phosphate synthase